MSNEKLRTEATRWFNTASEDLDAARIMRDNKKFAHACFLSQQASEKAVKSLHFFLDADPWGHSIVNLISELKEINPKVFEAFETSVSSARILDRFYIPTRYPDGLPDIIPSEAFGKEDADTAIGIATGILGLVQSVLTP